MPVAKFPMLLAAAAMSLAAPLAYAQDAAPASVDEMNAKDVPACSAKVTDHCMDKPGHAAHHKATHRKGKAHHAKHHATAKTSATAAPQKAAAPAAKKKI